MCSQGKGNPLKEHSMKKYSEALENVKTKLEVMKYKQEDILHAMNYRSIDFTSTNELMRVKMQIERNVYLLTVVTHKTIIDVLTNSIELLRLEEERLEGE